MFITVFTRTRQAWDTMLVLWRVVGPTPNPQAGVPPLVGCSQLTSTFEGRATPEHIHGKIDPKVRRLQLCSFNPAQISSEELFTPLMIFPSRYLPNVWPIQPLIQWIPGALSLGEADHSHPSSAEVKECVELYLHSPSMLSWRGTQLRKGTGTI
jgi:hypothetical protein